MLVPDPFSNHYLRAFPAPFPTNHGRLRTALEHGWPENDETLGPWLDEWLSAPWVEKLRKLPSLPLGVVHDPRLMGTMASVSSVYERVQASTIAALLLRGRALQLQARGDDSAALDQLLVVLVLSRNLRHMAAGYSYHVGEQMESGALHTFDLWLEKLGPKPDLLRRALAELSRHEAELPPVSDCVKAEYIRTRNMLLDPEALKSHYGREGELESLAESLPLETILAAPWEHERALRIVNAAFAEEIKLASLPYLEWCKRRHVRSAPVARFTAKTWLHELVGYGSWVEQIRAHEGVSLCRIRATLLRLALALFEIEQGRPAKTLDELVPAYLPSLPIDPFTHDKPFRYRVSSGEMIDFAFDDAKRHLAVQTGQGILWSIGPNFTDDGGKLQGMHWPLAHPLWSNQTMDVIYLVPRWQDGRRVD